MFADKVAVDDTFGYVFPSEELLWACDLVTSFHGVVSTPFSIATDYIAGSFSVATVEMLPNG